MTFTLLAFFALVVFAFFQVNNGKTLLTIEGTNFYINGVITYSDSKDATGTTKGLLLNCRMIQGVFDDANASTVGFWQYPDTKRWDAARNTNEFVGNMSLWKSYGLLSFTVGLQGGGPGKGYPNPQPWMVSAFDFKTGALDSAYLDRLDQILSAADALSMAPIVQFFYWGQANRFNKNNKVIGDAINNIIDWLIGKAYKNILIDVANECTSGNYQGTILHCSANMTTTISNIKQYIKSKTGKTNTELGIYLGSSDNGPPSNDLIAISDVVIMHGNSKSPSDIKSMIDTVRNSNAYKSNHKPIIFNEDPNTDWGNANNNMGTTIKNHASWGYYDQGKNDYHDGYQSPPVDWMVDTSDKTSFYDAVRSYTAA